MIGKKLLPYRHKIIEGNSCIVITDLRPDKETDIPVILAPGWGATCLFYERILFALRDSGRRVVGVEGGIDGKDAPSSWPDHESRKASAIIKAMDHLHVEKADLLGQSAGAFPVTFAAVLSPARFRNLILVTPAGFIGRMSFLKMMQSWLTNNIHDPLTRPVLAKYAGLFPAILKNIFSDLRVSYREIQTILNFPLNPFVPQIRKSGIRISVLYGENDTIIPPALLLSRVKDADLLMPMPGPHGSLILLPEGTEKVMEAFKKLADIQL